MSLNYVADHTRIAFIHVVMAFCGCSSTGTGVFMLFVFFVREHPNAQPIVVQV